MAWFWTDDLARRLVAAGVVGEDRVREWIHHPVAVSGGGDEDPLEVGRRLLGPAEPAAGAA